MESRGFVLMVLFLNIFTKSTISIGWDSEIQSLKDANDNAAILPTDPTYPSDVQTEESLDMASLLPFKVKDEDKATDELTTTDPIQASNDYKKSGDENYCNQANLHKLNQTQTRRCMIMASAVIGSLRFIKNHRHPIKHIIVPNKPIPLPSTTYEPHETYVLSTPELVYEYKPEVIIKNIKGDIDFYSNYILTCIVTAYPEPSIVWKDEKDEEILSVEPIRYGDDDEYILILKLNGVTRTRKYKCEASNKLGTAEDSIEVSVKSPFTIDKDVPHEVTMVYGVSKSIQCEIKSEFPIEITWWRVVDMFEKVEEVKTSAEFAILKKGLELEFIKPTPDIIGLYFCKAKSIQDTSIVGIGTKIKVTIGIQGKTRRVVYLEPNDNDKQFCGC